jgi:hypothetical protein
LKKHPSKPGVGRTSTSLHFLKDMENPHITRIVTEPSPSKLYTYLKKASIDSLAIVANQDPLVQLNPAVHSLGYLFILYVPLA